VGTLYISVDNDNKSAVSPRHTTSPATGCTTNSRQIELVEFVAESVQRTPMIKSSCT